MLKRTGFKRKGGGLKRSSSLKRKKIASAEDEYQRIKMNAFWMYVERNTGRRSEISGEWLPTTNKASMHHLWEKSTHPELKYSLGNIIRVTVAEHAPLNKDPDYYPQTAEARKQIMNRYDYYVNQSKEWSENYDRINKEE